MKTLDEQLTEIRELTQLLRSLNSARFVAEKDNYSNTKIVANFKDIFWSDVKVVNEFVEELNQAIKPLIEKRKNLLRSILAGLAIKEL